MLRVILVRHGETVWNQEKKYQGQSDIELTELGRLQAQKVAARLEGEKIAAVYASDLRRASETAQMIAEPHGLSVDLLPELREMNFGIWEGLNFRELSARYKEMLQAWIDDTVNTRIPGGETLAELHARVVAGWEKIKARHTGETVVVVAHWGPLSVLLCHLLGKDLSGYLQNKFDNAAMTVVECGEDGNQVLIFNDVSHLCEG